MPLQGTTATCAAMDVKHEFRRLDPMPSLPRREGSNKGTSGVFKKDPSDQIMRKTNKYS